MWELDHKEGWVLKNWCFWTVVLKKTLESPLDSKEIKLVRTSTLKFLIGRTGAEAPILWLPDAKSQLIGKDPDAGKDWRQKEKGTIEDEMVGWHHWLNARVWANSGRQWRTGKPGVLQSKGSQSDTTEWLNNRWETLLSQLWSREIVCFNLNLRSLESWLKQLSALTLIYTGIPIQAFTDTAALLHEAPYAN